MDEKVCEKCLNYEKYFKERSKIQKKYSEKRFEIDEKYNEKRDEAYKKWYHDTIDMTTKITQMEVAAVEEFYIERLKMISKIAHEIIEEEREKNA